MIIDSAIDMDQSINLDALARQAFELLVDLVPTTTSPELSSELVPYRALVTYEGPDAGAVMISCNEAFAFSFTEKFMQVARPNDFDEDTRDALGELANTIGGNYKGLLGPDTRLSTPHVTLSADPDDMTEKRDIVSYWTYTFGSSTCEVRLMR